MRDWKFLFDGEMIVSAAADKYEKSLQVEAALVCGVAALKAGHPMLCFSARACMCPHKLRGHNGRDIVDEECTEGTHASSAASY